MTHTQGANDRVSLGLPRRIAITGGASGIGLACAKLYVESGASVGLIGRSQEKLDAAAASLRALASENAAATLTPGSPGTRAGVGADTNASTGTSTSTGTNTDAGGTASSVVTIAADVSDEIAMISAIGAISTKLDGLDALVISAGVALETGLLIPDASVESFRQTLEINVLGAFIAAKAALPHLGRSDGATITIIGSDSGFVAVPGMVAYNASKGAIVQLTRALAVELHDTHGIRVNSVAPSIVDTPMARHDLGDELMDNPSFPLQSAEDIAWSVAYLSSRRARAINGHTLLSDFGYTGMSSFPA